MMKAFIKFNKGLMMMPMQWQIWLMLLVGANILVPLFFLDRLVSSQVSLSVMLLSMMLMTAVTHFSGFTRLLGLGHILLVSDALFLLDTARPDPQR